MNHYIETVRLLFEVDQRNLDVWKEGVNVLEHTDSLKLPDDGICGYFPLL